MADEVKEAPAQETLPAAPKQTPAPKPKNEKVKIILTGGGSCFIQNTLFKKGVVREVSSSVAEILLKTGLFEKK